MPFTPFHLGPALFFGLLLFRKIDFPTFVIASVIVDIEPFTVLFLDLNYPLHGLLHTFLGGSIMAIILSLFMIKFRNEFQGIMSFFRLGQNSSRNGIFLASFFGIYIHIVLDSYLYMDMKPFYPLSFNPIHTAGIFAGFEIYALCVILFIGGLVLYSIKSA